MIRLPAWVRKAFWSCKWGPLNKPTPIKYYVFHFEVEWCTICTEVQWHFIGHCNTLPWCVISIKSGLMMFVNLTIKGRMLELISGCCWPREKGESWPNVGALIGGTQIQEVVSVPGPSAPRIYIYITYLFTRVHTYELNPLRGLTTNPKKRELKAIRSTTTASHPKLLLILQDHGVRAIPNALYQF